MAEEVEIDPIGFVPTYPSSQQTRPGGPNILYSLLASVAVGGLLLGMMGLTFLASIATLLLSFPVLLVFSPVIFPAGFVIATCIAGVGAAAGMALVGVADFAWICRCPRGRSAGVVDGGMVEQITESGKWVREEGRRGPGRIAQHKVRVSPPEDLAAADIE